MANFVCIGDVTQDNFFFLSEKDASVHCRLNTNDCELTLRYGQKIPVEQFFQTMGGNAANVSVGVSRLGLKTGLVTVFGGDERGQWIRKKLLAEKVNIEISLIDEKRESNNSCILVFHGERTILTYHSIGDDHIVNLPNSDWYYITSSSGRDSGRLHEKIVQNQKNNSSIKIAFNPAVADLKKGLDFLKPMLAITNTLILNWEEAETLLEKQEFKIKDQKEKAKEMFKKFISHGIEIAVITAGVEGAYCYDGEKFLFCEPARWFKVKETTGAGDAFSSGFLAGLVSSGNVQDAMLWGMVNSGSVVSKVGGQEGLLGVAEIKRELAEHKDFQVKQI